MQVLSTKEEMVFRRDTEQYGTFYTLGMSKRNQDGSYTNGYMDIRFRQGVDIPNRSKIMIKDSFLSFRIDKDKKTIPFIMVLDYDLKSIPRDEDGYREIDYKEEDLPWN